MKKNRKRVLTIITFTLIILAFVWLMNLLSEGSKKPSAVDQFSFENATKQTIDPSLCVIGGCSQFDGKTTQIDITKDIKGFQSISILLRPGQVDNLGIMTINDSYKIIVKDGQIKVSSPKSFVLFGSENTSSVFINGKQSATLFPYYWQQVTISFKNPFDVNKITFGKVDKLFYSGFMDEAIFYNYALSNNDSEKNLNNLLNQIKLKEANNAQ